MSKAGSDDCEQQMEPRSVQGAQLFFLKLDETYERYAGSRNVTAAHQGRSLILLVFKY